jgi:hypothetical protein
MYLYSKRKNEMIKNQTNTNRIDVELENNKQYADLTVFRITVVWIVLW